jgi:hypothetical protein
MAVNIQRIANVELIRGAADEPETRLDLRNRRVMISTTVIADPELGDETILSRSLRVVERFIGDQSARIAPLRRSRRDVDL